MKEIRARFRKGLTLRRAMIEQTSSGMLAAAHRIFGNWRRAVQAAGLPSTLSQGARRWTRRELVELLRTLHKERGLVDRAVLSGFRREGYGSPLWSIRLVFGSEVAARRAAGIVDDRKKGHEPTKPIA